MTKVAQINNVRKMSRTSFDGEDVLLLCVLLSEYELGFGNHKKTPTRMNQDNNNNTNTIFAPDWKQQSTIQMWFSW